MDDLAAFLAACYDEEELLANDVAEFLADGGEHGIEFYALPGLPRRFLAKQTPAHRLADIALKRAILAEHRSSGGVYPTCARCASWSPGSYHGDEEDGEDPPDDMSAVGWPCPTVRQLGTEFAGQPGYREEWRP